MEATTARVDENMAVGVARDQLGRGSGLDSEPHRLRHMASTAGATSREGDDRGRSKQVAPLIFGRHQPLAAARESNRGGELEPKSGRSQERWERQTPESYWLEAAA